MEKDIKMRRWVMVFGVFDGLHPGHRVFLRQAKKYGGKLIAVVARDAAVRGLKGRLPRERERARLAKVRQAEGVSHAVFGDAGQGSYGVILRWKPDVICLGFDQSELEKDLKNRMRKGIIPRIILERLKPYHPDKFRSSLIS